MMRLDDPRQQGAGYQGRPLSRPAEELTDQGLRFDLVTVLNRRRVLQALGLGAASLGLAACGAADLPAPPSSGSTSGSATGSPSRSASAALSEIADETAGPYPGDGSNGPDVLEQSGIVRSDIRSSFGAASGTAEGVPMTLELVVKDLANGGAALAGAAVYVWHCDRGGGYSLYSTGITDQNYLRGVQVADADGRVRFTSVFPACYAGRWPHIHFEVYPDQAAITDSSQAIATSQVALPKDVCSQVYGQAGYESSVANLARVSLDDDNVFGDDDGAHQLATVTGSLGSGFDLSLTVGVDTTTAPTGGQPGGDGAPAGAPLGGAPTGPPPGGGPAPTDRPSRPSIAAPTASSSSS